MAPELKQAARMVVKNPGFAATAILILALASGVTTAIFSIAYGVLLRDLPYDKPDQLVTLWSKIPRMGHPKAYAGAADYFDWRKHQQVFEDIALTRAVGNFNLTGAGEPERLQGARATASLFSTLHATPLIGRTFTEQEQLDPGKASSVAVLSHGLWRRRFAGDPEIIGRKIQLNGQPHEVLGVMRPEFRYPAREFELWTPLYIPSETIRLRFDFSYLCVARLRSGITLDQARAQMETIAANLAREYPQNKDVGVHLAPMLSEITEAVRPVLSVLIAAVGTLFLIGCINLVNLMLAKATGRGREFAVRASLGATRVKLARQFFIETVPLAAAGSALGLLIGRWILDGLVPLLPPSMPRIEEIGLHGPVLVLSITLSALAAFAASVAPAMQVAAAVERGPSRRGRLRDSLIAAEIACTVVLLISAGLLMRSFAYLRSTDPGFEPDRALTLHLAVNRATHGDDRGVARYLGRLVDHVRAVPGVESVGIVNRLPMGGQAQTGSLQFEGRATELNADWRSASADYFDALGIPLLAGRLFNENDSADRPMVGIIDERAAREIFGHESPIGKRFKIGLNTTDMPWVEIVGMVGHLRHEGLDADPRPQVYWHYLQRTQDRMAMVVKAAHGNPAMLTAAVREAIRGVDPDQPLYDVRPMSEVVARTLTGHRLNLLLVGTFASLALLLASVGLYGLVSHLTTRRGREFGIRMALGASRLDVMGLVLRQGLSSALAGLAVGMALAAVVTRLLGAMLHGVTPFDPITYGAVGVILLAVVLAASCLPARRAMQVDPAETLLME